jgi:hypothetical protein
MIISPLASLKSCTCRLLPTLDTHELSKLQCSPSHSTEGGDEPSNIGITHKHTAARGSSSSGPPQTL